MILLSSVLLAGPLAAQGSPTRGELFYTRFGTGVNLKKVGFDWDGATLTLGAPQDIASLPGADGVVFGPAQNIFVGSQRLEMYEVDPATGAYQWTRVGQSIFHVSLDPGEQEVWAAGRPGLLTRVPINPFGNSTTHFLGGDDLTVTQLAFVGNGVYYTSSGFAGNGSFGSIDLATFTTTRILANVPAAHGMSVDPNAGELFLFGAQHVMQIRGNPASPAAVARLDLSGTVTMLGQGAVDGRGHAFVTDSGTGNLVFLDYSGSGLIDDPSTIVRVAFVEGGLEAIAPLVGLGSPCGRSAAWSNYGSGWPGTQGVPGFTSSANPVVGTTFALTLQNSAGAPTPGCIAFGLNPAAIPTAFGGMLLVGTVTAKLNLVVPAGGVVLPLPVPATLGSLCGVEIYAQGLQLDFGASHNVSFSPGLDLAFGL